MTPTEFKALKYGDILAGPGNSPIIVLHTNRDANDDATALGILPCILPDQASKLTLIAHAPQETVMIAPDATGAMIGILKTVPEEK